MEANSGGRIRFPDLIRSQIADEFKKQIAKQGTYVSHYDNLDEDAEVFIEILESFANDIPAYQKEEPPDHQVRRERMASIARHLGELAQKLHDIDSAALGYLLYAAMEEEEKRTGNPMPDMHPWGIMLAAKEKRKQITPILRDLSLGAQMAAKNLPKNDFEERLQVALCLERHFYDYQLKFSVTEAGFSALCLRAIFESADLDAGSIKYWLRRARDHDDSMSSVNAAVASRLDTEEE